MTHYDACVAYFSIGFILGVIGLAADADRLDDAAETTAWMIAWTLLSPLMLGIIALTLVLEKFFGIHGSEKDDE
jgi:hypothetical protein